MNESVLIGDAEKFLDEIKRSKIYAEKIVDFKYFNQIYKLLKINLDKLHEFKDLMELKGYKAPYRSLARFGASNVGEIMVEDLQDVTRHNQYFRMKAAAKKNILDRINSSISSHKIAIGHLEESVLITCETCHKKYKGHEISSVIMSNTPACECGSVNLSLKKNVNGVYRLAILKYLPLSGDYMVKMSDLSFLGRDAYKKIVNILKHEKRGAVKTVSLVIKVLEDGRWIRKRVSLDAEKGDNYEKELQKKYGSNVRIEFLQFHRKKPSIINDKHTRTSLSLAYVKLAEDVLEKNFKQIMNKHLNHLDKIDIYDQAKKTVQELVKKEESVDDPGSLKKVHLRTILKEKGLIDEKDDIIPELKAELEKRKKFKNKLFTEVPKTLILWDIGKYYLTTSYDRRSKYSGPFPYLRPNLDRYQMQAFDDFDKFTIKFLEKYMQENIIIFNNFRDILAEKFKMEKKTKGIHLRANPTAFGAAVFKFKTDIDTETVSNLFQVTKKDLLAELKIMDTFGKPKSKRAEKFLEIIKK
ncbi:MAG: DUF530 domain-containing protein [Methanobacteriaceae archaeon]|nr:DUF530 domain-containing protein [Methanobacteriaceae archaeon]